MIVKKVDLLAPLDEKQSTLYEIVGEIADKTNEVIDTVNNLDPTNQVSNTELSEQITALSNEVDTKADLSTTLAGYGIMDAYTVIESDFLLSEKADKDSTYTKTEIDTSLTGKADRAATLAGYGIGDAYTKSEVNAIVSGGSPDATTLAGYGITDAYTKTEVDTQLLEKADKATTLAGYGIGDAYTKTQVDASLVGKADDATTLAGYGITDAYTKTQVDTSLGGKADISDLTSKADTATTLAGYGITDAYTKTQVDTSLAAKADDATTLAGYGITDAYTKTQVDTSLAGKASTTHTHNYVDIANKPATFPPPLMSGSTVGGAIVGNGLGMSGSYLFLKALRGLKIDTADNAVVIDRAVSDTWYQEKGSLVLTNVSSFSNGWTHLTGRELKYTVTGENMLWLSGLLDGAAATTSATGAVLCTLPTGLTPQVKARCVVGLTGDLQGMVDVNTDRTVTIASNLTGVSTYKGFVSINIMVPLV